MVEKTTIVYKKTGFRIIQGDSDTWIPYRLLDEINKGYAHKKKGARKEFL